MSFRNEVSKLEDVKDGDVIKAEHKNELNRALRKLARAIDTVDINLRVEGDLEVNRSLLVGYEDWVKLKIEQAKDDRYNPITGEGGENAPEHIHISTTRRGVIEYNNCDVWINEGGLRVERDLVVGGSIILGRKTCPICGKELQGDVVFRVEPAFESFGVFYRFIPVHASCVLRVKLEGDFERKVESILNRLTLRSYPSKKKLYPIDVIRHIAFGNPGVTVRFGFIDDESMKNNTEMLVKIEKHDKYWVTIYACGWWGAEVEFDGKKICNIVPQEGRAIPIALALNDNLELIEVTTADGRKIYPQS